MAVHQLTKVIENLRRRSLPDEPRVSDGQLLAQFIAQQDEFAFAALVQRHSPMVWGVCRRIVGHHQDAEDAFQATFLVLARKATSIRPREMVANWLFGVARRTALKAKTMAGKRQAREKQMTTLPEAEAAPQGSWRNLELLIDQELANLPDKYRIAIILCDLEGKKGKDVAGQLKIPEGTLASRLRTGRVMLAKRLTRHGMTLSGGALATAISQNAASACVPSALVSSTIKAATLTAAGETVAAGLISANAAALTEGVVKAMLVTKLKTVVTALLVVGLVGFGGGLVSHDAAVGQQVPSAEREGAKSANPQAIPPTKDAVSPKTDREKSAVLTQAYQKIVEWRDLIEARRNERKAYGDAVDARFKALVGKGTVDALLLDLQRRFFVAQVKEYQAIAEYNDSLVRFETLSTKTLSTKKGKVHSVTYPVADLVVPIGGLDVAQNSTKKERDKTKEDWLIKKIMRTVSPGSWEASGGTGTIEYYPLGMVLVVNNTPRVQAQVKYLLETMRRMQEMEVVAETRILSLNAASYVKLQSLFPHVKKDGHVVLSDTEALALIRKAQDDTDSTIVQAPKITFLPGQRVSLSIAPCEEVPGSKKTDIKLNAFVAANLQHIELEVRATVGKAEFSKAVRLEDGMTLAQFKRSGDDYLVLLVTPRVILNSEEAVVAPGQSRQAAPPRADEAPKRNEEN